MNQTALFYAARQGHAETIKFLLSKNLIVSACPWRAAWGARGGHQWGNGAAGMPIEFVLFFIFFWREDGGQNLVNGR